jgi:hypothetical protein
MTTLMTLSSKVRARVEPTADEVRAPMPGDDLVPGASVTMDRAFTVAATPDAVWPWIVQLGKRRAGWYFPRSVERFIPRKHRAVRGLDPRYQALAVGDVIPDYGGSDATFEVTEVAPPNTLVYWSRRGHTEVSWAITLTSYDGTSTRVRLRLRLGPVKRAWLATTIGDAFDLVTIAGMAAGLEERLRDGAQPR